MSRLAFAIAVTLLLGAVLSMAAGPLAALPALLAFLPLLANRYVGVERLERLIARGQRRLRPLRAIAPRVSAARQVIRPRGPQLLACSLAERAPPLLLVH